MTEEEIAKVTADVGVSDWLEKGQVKSDGGYAPVSGGDFQELEEIICALIRARWEIDPDGDLPVEVTLVNRTTHQRLHYRPVPYGRPEDHPIAQAKVDAEVLDRSLSNLRLAMEDLSYGRTFDLFKFIRDLDAPAEADEEAG